MIADKKDVNNLERGFVVHTKHTKYWPIRKKQIWKPGPCDNACVTQI